MNIKQYSFLLFSAIYLSACGGSGSSSSDIVESPSLLTLNVSDAPIDEAVAVVVEFDSIELIGDGQPVTIDIVDNEENRRQIDLLSVQGENFVSLIKDIEITPGTYEQLRLNVTSNSYIELVDGVYDLIIPSNQLKLDGITVNEGQNAAYTVEFDLRKALVEPTGQSGIFLKPRGVRLVENTNVGTISGTVAQSLIESVDCLDKLDLDIGNAVYIYQEHGFSVEQLGDDADTPSSADEVSPYAIAEVSFNEENAEYQFEAAYLPTGNYTAGFTCLALNDLPESDEGAEQGFNIQSAIETSVQAMTTSIVEFD